MIWAYAHIIIFHIKELLYANDDNQECHHGVLFSLEQVFDWKEAIYEFKPLHGIDK